MLLFEEGLGDRTRLGFPKGEKYFPRFGLGDRAFRGIDGGLGDRVLRGFDRGLGDRAFLGIVPGLPKGEKSLPRSGLRSGLPGTDFDPLGLFFGISTDFRIGVMVKGLSVSSPKFSSLFWVSLASASGEGVSEGADEGSGEGASEGSGEGG